MTHQDNQRAAFEAQIELPPLPEREYLGDDASYGYDAHCMRDYALAAIKHASKSQGEPVNDKSDHCRINGCSHQNDGEPVWRKQPAEPVRDALKGMQRFFGKWPEFVPADEYIGAAQAAVQRMNDALSAPQPAEQSRGEPVVGEKFMRAWVGLKELPGSMMIGPEGRFGPVPASTSCWITTSENAMQCMKAKGPVMEVWTTPQPAEPTNKDSLTVAEPVKPEDGPQAYCEVCQKVGMRNCSDFINCGNARCLTCKQLLTAEPVKVPSDEELRELWLWADLDGFDEWARNVRALLASYGNAAQPAASVEHTYAEQEGKRNAAADGYFKVRARLMDTSHNRRIFEAGFDRGYESAPVAAQPSVPEPIQPTGEGFHAAYAEGWNNCRDLVLAAMPAHKEAQ